MTETPVFIGFSAPCNDTRLTNETNHIAFEILCQVSSVRRILEAWRFRGSPAPVQNIARLTKASGLPVSCLCRALSAHRRKYRQVDESADLLGCRLRRNDETARIHWT